MKFSNITTALLQANLKVVISQKFLLRILRNFQNDLENTIQEKFQRLETKIIEMENFIEKKGQSGYTEIACGDSNNENTTKHL